MKRLRLLLFVLLLTILFIVQNNQVVQVSFMFWSVEMPRILLMSILLLIGFVLGYGFHYWWQTRHQHDLEKKIWH